jgi:hypothetical protein
MTQRWVIRASRALWLWEVFWNVCAAAASSDMDQDMEKAVVLIVEDEALIRISAVHIVEDAGFMAVDACDADEAIAILERRNDVWAVFSDIIMGRTKAGLRLAKVIRNRWPPIHFDPDVRCPGWRRIFRTWALYSQTLYRRTCCDGFARTVCFQTGALSIHP